ncbi:MAG: tyrosine-type recombinase/integrase [FCB group bacterium]|nr:tyrosine-type recombinase/integrase [FCB group bacterium]
MKIIRGAFDLERKDITIDRLIDQFLEYNRTNNRESTTRRYRAVTDHFQRFLNDHCPDIKLVSQLTANLVERYKLYRKEMWVHPNGYPVLSEEAISDKTRKGARARTINLEVDGIKAMLNCVVRLGYIRDHPLRGIKPLKEDDRKPVRFLTADECKQFLNATPAELYPIFFTLLNTGMRKAEIENLRWCDVDFDRRIIHIRGRDDWKPKAGDREIPIGDTLSKVFNTLGQPGRDAEEEYYVFGLKGSGHSHNRLRRELIKIAKKAGIENLTKVHTLRHTFASQLLMNGVDLATVNKLMGHSDIKTTMIYASFEKRHLADAINKLPFD